MTWHNPIALLQNKIALFILLSAALHSLLLLNWKDPLQFDFGGQQLNQQRIEIALTPPAPEQPQEPRQEPLQEVTPPQPTPPQPEAEVAIEEVVEAVTEPKPEPEPVVTAPAKEPSQPIPVEPTPQPQPKPKPKPIQPRKQPVPFQQQKIAQQAAQKRAKLAPPAKQEKPKAPPPPPKPAEKAVKEVPKKTAQKPAPKALEDAEKVRESEAIQQSRATIRRLIQADLIRHFQYPRLARRKGWEGKVLLEFTVQPDGSLSNILVLEGSRYSILNRSAIETMVRIGTLNQVSKGDLSKPIRMEIPIIYQLK